MCVLNSRRSLTAQNCQFVHSLGKLGPLGENLAAAGTSQTTDSTPVDAAGAFKGWADEASDWEGGNEAPSHFTQGAFAEARRPR